MVPRRRRADVGRASTFLGERRLPQGAVPRRPRSTGSGLPGIAFSDGPRGAWSATPPASRSSMARGATWDPDLEERVGEAIGRELRAAGANLTGAVCVNLLRHPAWGRAQETYGEDPHHVGELGAALTRGLQRHVLACVKHFACNSMENARFTVDIDVDEVALHEVYLPALPPDRRRGRRVGDVGLQLASTASGAARAAALLTDVLRGEWGFEGFVISDWIFGLRDAATLAGRRPRHRDAVPDGAGRSTCPAPSSDGRGVLGRRRRAPSSGSSPPCCASTTSCRRRPPPREVLGSPEHRALAREVAARSVVLLRNEPVDGAPVLPLAADGASPVRRAPRRHRQPRRRRVERRVGPRLPHGPRRAPGRRRGDVAHDDGSDVERAAAVAADADVAVVVVGYTYLDEGEYIGETDPVARRAVPAADEPEVVERFQAWLADAPADHQARRGSVRAAPGLQPRRRPHVAAPARRRTSS